jgi:site-specific DNA-methyltransferase (adenine-specific)
MTASPTKQRAPRNRTITIDDSERTRLTKLLKTVENPVDCLPEGIVHGDCLKIAPLLPSASVSLLFLDPPYNLTKKFNGSKFNRRSVQEYTDWLDNVIVSFKRCLTTEATIYICGDWYSSASIFEVATEHFIVRNRITWEREKGRGALTNWKNSSEDIWFCTVSDSYQFHVDEVKLRRKVIAPYRNQDGTPKDWSETADGQFRDTHPSNLWTDITIPFWSMPENTDHPTQKSEKLLAKLILASSSEGDWVLDPFAGSGTTCVVAQKLGRKNCGIELDNEYACLAQKRLEMAACDCSIQGYKDKVFWERNTLSIQEQAKPSKKASNSDTPGLFP